MSHALASRPSGPRVAEILVLLTAIAIVLRSGPGAVAPKPSQAAPAEAPSGPAAGAMVTFGEAFEACPTRATLRRLRRGDDVGGDEMATCRTLDAGKPYRVVVPASPSSTGEVWIKVEPDASSLPLWVNARPGSATLKG
jgi:hypothetical protein